MDLGDCKVGICGVGEGEACSERGLGWHFGGVLEGCIVGGKGCAIVESYIKYLQCVVWEMC